MFNLPSFTGDTIISTAINSVFGTFGDIFSAVFNMLPQSITGPIRQWAGQASTQVNTVLQPLQTAANEASNRIFGAATGQPNPITPQVALAAQNAGNPTVVPTTGTPAPIAPVVHGSPQVQVS